MPHREQERSLLHSEQLIAETDMGLQPVPLAEPFNGGSLDVMELTFHVLHFFVLRVQEGPRFVHDMGVGQLNAGIVDAHEDAGVDVGECPDFHGAAEKEGEALNCFFFDNLDSTHDDVFFNKCKRDCLSNRI